MISAFFTADYRDGRVIFGGKSYPAGVFATHLLNQFYINDTTARIAVFRDDLNYHILTQLSNGYLNITEFVKTGANILEALKALPKLRPFDGMNIEEIRNSVTTLFTEENGQKICGYFADKAKLSLLSQNEIAAGTADRMKTATDFSVIENNIAEIKSILLFFNTLADDLILAHGNLLKFCNRINEAERLDEAHLLPLALEIFGDHHFTQSGRYISVKKNAKSVTGTVAKRLNFDSYYSFILTDFFEGLHYGHYPRKCEICGKYFLMQSARRQKYCSYGTAPQLYNGEKVSCRRYAAILGRSERAKDNPLRAAYTKRCSAIRSEKSRGTITAEFAAAAQDMAKRRLEQAEEDDIYAAREYYKDLERVKLYTDTNNRLYR